MNSLALLQVRITNLLAQAVKTHDKIGHAIDDINEEVKTGKPETSLKDAGTDLKSIIDTYEELRDVCIAFEYAAGHDMFTIMNDFKLTKATVVKALKKEGFEIKSK